MHPFALQEYNATDGALEPGRSYGGACCNTFLKVVYDAANDAVDAAQSAAANESLFADDEEEEEEASTCMPKSIRSGFSLDMACQNNIAVTWADLLRQMKAEFKEIGYEQIPKVTTTRKIDLNSPFSLVPDDFEATKGKKRSLLIGCNYASLGDAELKASHDDIRSMKVSFQSSRLFAWHFYERNLSLTSPLLFPSSTGLHRQCSQLSRISRADDSSFG